MNRTSWKRMLLAHVIEAGDPRVKDLLSRGGVAEAWDWIRTEGSTPAAWRERAVTAEARAERSVKRAEAAGLRWVTPEDADWPRQLGDLAGFEGINGVQGGPLGIWVAGGGDLSALTSHAVAVVGARSCTTYGAEMATDIAADCADAGHTVISGAAFGIDACAHRGALVSARPTVAVVACGADVDYPRAHAALLSRIAEEGLIISEHPPGESAQRHRFLARNRLIAALAGGVVVVEAARRSGSLNTLHWGDQLGRVTMAVPGPVTSAASGGTHAAIRDGKAILVTSGTEVIGELSGFEPEMRERVSAGARRVWWELADQCLDVPTLALRLRVGVRSVSRGLEELAGLGLVNDHGGAWQRISAG